MKKRGQSIIEVVIAGALISTAIIACLTLVNYTQKQASFSRNLNTATTYNNQAADWIRSERENLGWTTLVNKLENDSASRNSVTYCLNDLPTAQGQDFTSLTPGDCGTTYISTTIFSRMMTADVSNLIANPNSGIVTIVIATSWMDTSPRRTSFTMELSEWN